MIKQTEPMPTENGNDTPHLTMQEVSRASWSLSLGSALEYYDFALYSLASALVFGPLFFPSSSPAMAIIKSFGTYFLGFAVRPIGGIIFGALGDHIGRKKVLLITVTMMGIASTLIGAIPTYQTIGLWAPALLIFLRLVQGFGAGAEQAGASVMMTEIAPIGRRGLSASLPYMGIQLGTVLAAIVYFLVIYNGDITQNSFLWRIPFLSSIFVVGVALLMRIKLKESPAFEAIKAKGKTERIFVPELVRRSWKPILVAIGLRYGDNGGSSIYQVLALSFMINTVGMGTYFGPLALMIAAFVGAIIVPIAGLMSDKWGRVFTYRFFSLVLFFSAIPVWYSFTLGNPILSVIALSVGLGCGAWGCFGAQGAMMAEMFGSGHRYLGVSFARELSAVVAGGITPLVGSLIIKWTIDHSVSHTMSAGTGAWLWLGCYVMVMGAISYIATLFLPEFANRDLLDPKDVI
ncbi:MFS transporter [Entomobacter blattae]|uniref:Proline/betaine transporter n=1 Tax=Entomobacter blattae TaxID=2762277 RepID=A0A7H1NRR8_9PROT|nr:MFS transporter [Entomobacter blattae]QNT78478.1 Proline/betaine transporter [Entomobacter blattae]